MAGNGPRPPAGTGRGAGLVGNGRGLCGWAWLRWLRFSFPIPGLTGGEAGGGSQPPRAWSAPHPLTPTSRVPPIVTGRRWGQGWNWGSRDDREHWSWEGCGNWGELVALVTWGWVGGCRTGVRGRGEQCWGHTWDASPIFGVLPPPSPSSLWGSWLQEAPLVSTPTPALPTPSLGGPCSRPPPQTLTHTHIRS